MYNPFIAASPVWAKGLETEMNCHVAFVAKAPAGNGTLRLTCSTAYTLYINGEFVCMGPARAARGWYRVDEIDVSARLTQKSNVVSVEVAGYNANGYCYVDQPSFLQAELVVDGVFVAVTGGAGFTAVRIDCRVQKTQRYSFQRIFTEHYRLAPDSRAYRKAVPANGLRVVPVGEKQLLPRGVKLLEYPRADAAERVAAGTVEPCEPKKLWEDRALLNIGEQLKGFPKPELDGILSEEVQRLRDNFDDRVAVPYAAELFEPGAGAIYKFAHNTAGLLGVDVKCRSAATVYLVFDEILVDGDIQFWRADCTSVVKYELAPGSYSLLSTEPYVAQYVKVVVLGGACEISNLHIRQVVCPGVVSAPKTDDPTLRGIHKAAVETFRQNAVDIFMDCPSRERAGWLCDSFWTARVERHLTGESRVERNFLENFLLPEKFEHLPDGVFPMCYPCDHYDGIFIPNWCMWLVLELEEYLARTGDRAMVDAYRSKCYGLIAYFDKLTNADGLLEKLESWVFLEWSESNRHVQDVNYPSNMLWARTLEAIADLYGDDALRSRAARIKEVVREQSFRGRFFTDNAVRENGVLVNPGHTTESCQYYAFFTGTATPETYPKLWKTLVTDFGPGRKQTHAFADVPFANAFIGNYLRLELLSRSGLHKQLLDELSGYFAFMADTTGTLWEHDRTVASCDHGFASHVACWIDE